MPLYCVEIGRRQRKNLCRMLTSIVVPAKSPSGAVRYVESHCSDALVEGSVQRVFEAKHVIVDWPSGAVSIADARPSQEIVFDS